MVDPTTINKSLPQPVPGSDTDAWTSPYNSVFEITDNSFGGTATIAVSSVSATLASSQFQCVFLTFTGALTANISITLPAVGSFYTVSNNTTGSSAFTITLRTTAAGSRAIGLPPEISDIMTDGSNVRFRSLPYVGSYWNYSGSSTPAWVSACTVPPWIYCDGSAISSATYPALTAIMGTSTVPDLRGRSIAYLNDGTNRITSGSGGIDGNTRFSAGGAQSITLSSLNLPNVNFNVTDPGHTHSVSNNGTAGTGLPTAGGPGTGSYHSASTINVSVEVTGITVTSGGNGTPFAIMAPAVVSGITLIRGG